MALIQKTVLQFKPNLCGPGTKTGRDRSRGQLRFHGGSDARRVKLEADVKMNVETVNGKMVNGVGADGMIPMTNNEYMLGRFAEGKFVFRQLFVIRSYEIGPDKTATMETIMNLLQETALNHVANSGVAGDGLGVTREMSIRKLIWVVTRLQIQIDKYSSWGDVLEVDTWFDAAGKNRMRRDWVIRDCKSQSIITRATSTWVMMNRETRRLSKIPVEVRNELKPFYLHRNAVAMENADTENIPKLTHDTAGEICDGLAPRRSDMDANQHVNNVKYIGWILESVPINVLEDYDIKNMTLEYRRECHQSDMLQSLTRMNPKTADQDEDEKPQHLECTHLLCMEDDQAEIVRARTMWQVKNS